jgi:type IV pilus assembly protein PilN
VIRINLLPDAVRPQQSQGGQGWLIALLALLAVEVVSSFIVYSVKQDELRAQKEENARTEQRIKQSREAVEDRADVTAKLAVLRSREEAIERLQRARLGPAAMMIELSHILTKNRGPSITPDKLAEVQEANPLSSYNQGWDPRRLWLLEFTEEEHVVRLVGLARDGEDVSELARRMNLSAYFSDIRLLPAKREKESATGIEWIKFQLEARVRY